MKITEEELKQMKLAAEELIVNYTDEKIEHMLEEWLDFEFKANDMETIEQYEHRKQIMLTLLMEEKLRRMEAEYVEEAI